MLGLRYTESGEFRPSEGSSIGGSLTTRNQLVYDFSDWERVDIYYDDPSSERGPVADLADLRFECSLRPETMELTEHPDGPDVYQGKWDIDAANAFLTTWTVSGPRQSGTCQYFCGLRRICSQKYSQRCAICRTTQAKTKRATHTHT